MARARNIKPGFFTNDLLAEVNPLGRLLFAGLWTIADRAGRLEDRVKKIKAQVLPYDDCDCDLLLKELHNRGFILRYEIDGNAFIQVVKWDEHQNPHIKEADSTIQAPYKNSATPEKAPSETGASHADSLNPITDSLNPIQQKLAPDGDMFDGISSQIVADFKAMRKIQKAPITQTAIDGIRREAKKAGLTLEAALGMCCERSWRGFKAEWITQPTYISHPQAPPSNPILPVEQQVPALASKGTRKPEGIGDLKSLVKRVV